jgi:hypothetical protein
MEKVQKTTQSVKPFGSPDEHGNQGYWVNFTDGSKGIFNTPRQDLFIEGQPAEFSIKEMRHSEKAGDYAILQRYKEPYEPGKKSEKSLSPEDKLQINRSVSIKAACELLAGSSNNNPERVIEAAEVFFDYIQFGVTDKAEMPEPPKVDPENVLPF